MRDPLETLPECEPWPEWQTLEKDGHTVHAAMRNVDGVVYAVIGEPRQIAVFIPGCAAYRLFRGDPTLLPAWAEMMKSCLRGTN